MDKFSWAIPPKHISETEITKREQADVVHHRRRPCRKLCCAECGRKWSFCPRAGTAAGGKTMDTGYWRNQSHQFSVAIPAWFAPCECG